MESRNKVPTLQCDPSLCQGSHNLYGDGGSRRRRGETQRSGFGSKPWTGNDGNSERQLAVCDGLLERNGAFSCE